MGPVDEALPLLQFVEASARVGQAHLVRDITWTVASRERWAVLGPNGSGKTTLFRMASGYLHPTTGRVGVLGRQLGRTDVRALRREVAVVSSAVAKMLIPGLTAWEVVVTGRAGALEPWWDPPTRVQEEQARQLLSGSGVGHVADRPFGLLSDGERQQVLLARALMGGTRLLLLDEPCAGLDMGAREKLVSRLGALASDPSSPAIVLITHHVEEVPVAFTHALLLQSGRVMASGGISQVITAEALSRCFGLPLALDYRDGRWSSRALD